MSYPDYNLFRNYEKRINNKDIEKTVKLFGSIKRLIRLREFDRKKSLQELVSVERAYTNVADYNTHAYSLYKKIVVIDIISNILSVFFLIFLPLSIVISIINLLKGHYQNFYNMFFNISGLSVLCFFIYYRKKKLNALCLKYFMYDNLFKIEPVNCFLCIANLIMLFVSINFDMNLMKRVFIYAVIASVIGFIEVLSILTFKKAAEKLISNTEKMFAEYMRYSERVQKEREKKAIYMKLQEQRIAKQIKEEKMKKMQMDNKQNITDRKPQPQIFVMDINKSENISTGKDTNNKYRWNKGVKRRSRL